MAGLFDWTTAQLHVLSPTDIVVAIGALLLVRACTRLGMWLYALVALPGTLAHELAHYLVALLLLAQPTFPSLIPVRTGRGWRMGSVAFRAGMVRAVPIALAPIVLLPLALFWAAHWLAPAVGPLYWLHAWVVGALLSASLPSSADFKLAIPALMVLAVLAALAWFFSRALGSP
jgi:hypothetical protein